MVYYIMVETLPAETRGLEGRGEAAVAADTRDHDQHLASAAEYEGVK